jgi:2-oxoisovalerate dehydrogenase E1 component
MFFPQTAWILDALHERIRPLRGHQPRTKQALATLVDREKLGI